jgi:hypothetical protein
VNGPTCLLAFVLFASRAAQAADLDAAPVADPFAPAHPLGIASALPRSPLADVTVFGTERFGTASAARSHCPRDVVVRVEAPWAFYYAAAHSVGDDIFMCRSSALSEGDLPR